MPISVISNKLIDILWAPLLKTYPMTKNSVFRTFLMISTLIILAGILLIIFIQFDRGYVDFSRGTKFFEEQKNLIKHVYQTQVAPEEPQDNPLVMKLNKATVVIQTEPDDSTVTTQPEKTTTAPVETAEQTPVEQQVAVVTYSPPATIPQTHVAQEPVASMPTEISSITPQVTQQPMQNTWQQSQTGEDYYLQLLRNNPWSPYYKIGH